MGLGVLGLLALAALAGCGGAYEPGTLDEFGADGRRVRAVGCLDVRVSARPIEAAPAGFLAVDVDFGNRCAHPVEVALSRMRVVASGDGASASVPPYDPRSEIRVAVLDGQSRAHEALAFEVSLSGGDAAASPPSRFCVDVSRVARHDERAAPVCFRAREGEMHVESM